jgi:hypothetical protein
MKRSTSQLALVLLPAFFLLHNYNELFGFIPGRLVLFYALLIYAVIVIAYFILRRRRLAMEKIFLILFILLFFILFFGPLHSAYRSITFRTRLSSFWVMLPLSAVVLILLINLIVRAKRLSPKIFVLLNLVMITLFGTELVIAFGKAIEYRNTHNLIYPQKPLSSAYVPSNAPDTSKPDIYFLVFDEYTSSSMLKKFWGFDNSPITDWLTQNGFHVGQGNQANYTQTTFSVSSTLNMNYIDKRLGENGIAIPSLLRSNQSLSNNETFEILKKEHYGIRFIAPFNNTIEDNGQEYFFDYYIKLQIPIQTLLGNLAISVKEGLITGRFPLIHSSQVFDHYLAHRYQLIRMAAEEIKKTVDSTSNRLPHFVYGHFLVPHEPHFFDSAGHFLSQKEFMTIPEFQTYPAQIRHANALMKEIVSYIKQNNKPNTIIIIEGDHGFRNFPDSPVNVFSLPNFSAIYFPDGNYSRLYDGMSPVNTFRIVFDQYFKQTYPLLPDVPMVITDY